MTTRTPIDWLMVGSVAVTVALIMAMAMFIVTEVRFARNYAVACTKAGGTFVSLDGNYNCVTIKSVAAEVTR